MSANRQIAQHAGVFCARLVPGVGRCCTYNAQGEGRCAMLYGEVQSAPSVPTGRGEGICFDRSLCSTKTGATGAACACTRATRARLAWWAARRRFCATTSATAWATACRPAPWTPSASSSARPCPTTRRPCSPRRPPVRLLQGRRPRPWLRPSRPSPAVRLPCLRRRLRSRPSPAAPLSRPWPPRPRPRATPSPQASSRSGPARSSSWA